MIEPIREYLKNIKEFGIDPLRGGLKLDHADKLCRMVEVLLDANEKNALETGTPYSRGALEAIAKCREIAEGK